MQNPEKELRVLPFRDYSMYKPYTVWAADFLQRTHTLQSSHLSSFLVVAQVEKPMKTLFPITDAYKNRQIIHQHHNYSH